MFQFYRSPAWSLLALTAAAVYAPAHADESPSFVGQDASSVVERSHHGTAHWQLVDEQRFYLQNPPGSLTGAFRTQGIATDGHEWFFSWQYGLEIADKRFNSVLRNSSIEPPAHISPGIPPALLAQGLDHIGDIDYHDGIIYASLDSTKGYTNGHVALYNAADLSYTGVSYAITGAPSNPHTDVASWIAVDAHHNRAYGKEWQLGNTINVYRLNDWSFSRVLTLDMPLDRIQGAKVHGEWLYLSSDNATHSIYRANLHSGHVEELFRLPTPAGRLEVEGIAVREGRGDCRHGDDVPDIYVEMVVDPDNSGADLSNPNIHVSLYHYRFQRERGRE